MSRVFEDRAYEAASLNGCFWAEDYPREDLVWPRLTASISVDVAIIGAGYTGMSAALHLARTGSEVAVLDMHQPGWGASGRSGGFCCEGGSKASDRSIRRRFGDAALEEWRQAQVAAVDTVADILVAESIDVDRHSVGETQLGHSQRAAVRLYQTAKSNGYEAIPTEALSDNGMNAAGLHGGMTYPVGFGLHPRKYVLGLTEAAQRAGANIYAHSPVSHIKRRGEGYQLSVGDVEVRARKLIIATNGYSRDDVPGWLRGRFMPVQSNILVSRKLSEAELQSQGWTTRQIVYDTRHLLHYWRLLPDNRMMFGMRGGISARPSSDRNMRQMIRRDFDGMFPAWRHVETPWFWTGLVCMTAKQVPFVGEIPEMPGAFAGFGWHGNGIAMGTYSGKLLAGLVAGDTPKVPDVMQGVPSRMPFGRHRRIVLPPIYTGLAVTDWMS